MITWVTLGKITAGLFLVSLVYEKGRADMDRDNSNMLRLIDTNTLLRIRKACHYGHRRSEDYLFRRQYRLSEIVRDVRTNQAREQVSEEMIEENKPEPQEVTA